MPVPEPAHLRAVVADDDRFLGTLITEVLTRAGFEVLQANDPEAAWRLVEAFRPGVVLTDLDFGTESTGIDLLQRAHAHFPGAGLILLTSHQDPQLVVGHGVALPSRTVYRVKGALRSADAILEAVEAALLRRPDGRSLGDRPAMSTAPSGFVVTAAQADVLRLLAQGASTKAIARERGTSVRAAEMLLKRLYETLQLDTGQDHEPRVQAARLWQQGAVRLGA